MIRTSTEAAWQAPARSKLSLEERLQPRIAVEQLFAQMGHTHRHGPYYRAFEHYLVRPLLRTGLRMSGLYERGLRNAATPVIREVCLSYPDLPAALEGFQILHLSDLHIEGTPGLADALAESLRGLRPDICLITGDFRFEDFGSCEGVYPLMRQVVDAIHTRHGIFGILGNHDVAAMALPLEQLGIRMLINEAVEIEAADAPLWIVGVDDPFDYQCHDLPLAMDSVPADSFKILLAHAPELYEEADEAGIQLYLSGHTHAGQIRLPGIGSIRHNARCPREYAHGAWMHGDLQGYTSAGIGCSGIPVRFNCPPEIVSIELSRR